MRRSSPRSRVVRTWAVSAQLVLCALLLPSLAAAQAPPWMDTSLSPTERTNLLLPQMTLEEKVALMTGDNPGPAGTGAYFNAAHPAAGDPGAADRGHRAGGPVRRDAHDRVPDGHRDRRDLESRARRGHSAKRWPRRLAIRGTTWCWGRTSTLPRQPWWSRIGETFGEDPLLSGRMAAGFVRGAQASGDMAVNLKHYNVYTQETNRRRGENTQNSVIDERTLQEIYTRPWASAVAEGLASVMCAYNRINGEHACEHGYLMEQVLRRQLGFDGFVLTDFGASYPHTVDTVEDGMDLETGAIVAYGQALLAAVRAGQVSETLINQRVSNILRVYFKFGVFDNPLPATVQPVPVEEHGGMAREIEQQAITLLKNRNTALPLQAATAPAARSPSSARARPTPRNSAAPARSPARPTRSRRWRESASAPRAASTCEYERGVDAPGPADLVQGPDAIPSSVLSPPGAPGQTGVRAEFLNNTTFSGAPFATRTDPRPQFDTGPIQYFAIHPEVTRPPAGARAVRYTGTITPPQSGSYRLSLSGFGTGRLVFDGRQIVSFANQIAPRAYVSDPLQLQAGQSYTFRLEYAETNPQGLAGPRPDPARLGAAGRHAVTGHRRRRWTWPTSPTSPSWSPGSTRPRRATAASWTSRPTRTSSSTRSRARTRTRSSCSRPAGRCRCRGSARSTASSSSTTAAASRAVRSPTCSSATSTRPASCRSPTRAIDSQPTTALGDREPAADLRGLRRPVQRGRVHRLPRL